MSREKNHARLERRAVERAAAVVAARARRVVPRAGGGRVGAWGLGGGRRAGRGAGDAVSGAAERAPAARVLHDAVEALRQAAALHRVVHDLYGP